MYQKSGKLDWNTYAMVGVIELARTEGKNPAVPGYLKESYEDAIRHLAALGASQNSSCSRCGNGTGGTLPTGYREGYPNSCKFSD